MLVPLKIDLDNTRAIALVDIERQCDRRGRNIVFFDGYLGVRIAFRGEHLAQDADGAACFYGVKDGFFRDADAFLAKFLEDVRLGQRLGALELQVADDRQLGDLENDIDAAANAVLGQDAGLGLVKKVEREQLFKVALEGRGVIDVARTGLDVIKQVLVAKPPVPLNIDALDDLLRRRGDRTKRKTSRYQCQESKYACLMHKKQKLPSALPTKASEKLSRCR